MCGIFLVFSKSGSSLHEGSCKSASMELNNRGPDHFKSSFFRNKTLFISNTILSITGKLSKKKTILKHQNFIKKNLDYVGENFAFEARSIHYDNKKNSKGIYGMATKEDLKELNEEGIDVETIPWEKNTTN